jgi:hypothetical protein
MGYSSLVGPLRWTGLVLAPEGVYVAQVNLFSTRSPTVAFFPTTTENPFVTVVRFRVQRFMEAARFPVTRYRVENSQHIVEYQEYGLSWGPAPRGIESRRKCSLLVGSSISYSEKNYMKFLTRSGGRNLCSTHFVRKQ